MFNETKDEVIQLYLDDIIPNRFQPREVFDEKALKELAVSIKEHGVIQPIIVRNVNGKYEIIAGERRYKASALAGMTKIPAIIRNLDDKESSKVALLENLQRKNLNPIEEARTYQKILEIDEMTQEELAKTMGKSQSAVANKIRLLSLPDEVQTALLKEKISERHARALLNIPDTKKQIDMLKKVMDNKMSVRNLEDEIKKNYPKDKNKFITKETTASTTDFVINNPLIPTTELPEDTTNFGKVTIAPPEGEEMPMSKFINYGEEEDSSNDDSIFNLSSVESEKKPEVKEIKQNEEKGADLDNLLNINSISGITTNDFITPAEEIVKKDNESDIEETSDDYFKTPDLESIGLPSGVEGTTILPTNNIQTEMNYSIDTAKEKIRNLAEELKEHGLPIKIDEMNFEKSYQIIIKIDKTQ